jgi:hypothetical protein
MSLGFMPQLSWEARLEKAVTALHDQHAMNCAGVMVKLGLIALDIGGEPSGALRQAIRRLILERVGEPPQTEDEADAVTSAATEVWWSWFGHGDLRQASPDDPAGTTSVPQCRTRRRAAAKKTTPAAVPARATPPVRQEPPSHARRRAFTSGVEQSQPSGDRD